MKLHFEELDFHDASEEEWREKLLQHFHQDQGISTDACARLKIEFAEGTGSGFPLSGRCVLNCPRYFDSAKLHFDFASYRHILL